MRFSQSVDIDAAERLYSDFKQPFVLNNLAL